MLLQYLRCSCNAIALVSRSSRTAGPPGSPFHSEQKAAEGGALAPGVRSIRPRWLHELCKSAAVLTKRAITSCHPQCNFLTSASLLQSEYLFFSLCRPRIEAEQPSCPVESPAVRKHSGRRRRPRRRPGINLQLIARSRAMAAVPALHGANYGTWMQEFSGASSIDLLQTPQTSEFDLFLNDGPLQSTPCDSPPRIELPPHLLARLLHGQLKVLLLTDERHLAHAMLEGGPVDAAGQLLPSPAAMMPYRQRHDMAAAQQMQTAIRSASPGQQVGRCVKRLRGSGLTTRYHQCDAQVSGTLFTAGRPGLRSSAAQHS